MKAGPIDGPTFFEIILFETRFSGRHGPCGGGAIRSSSVDDFRDSGGRSNVAADHSGDNRDSGGVAPRSDGDREGVRRT